ncbi:hypothetical protein [Streptomyces antimycoticus]|uniref:hypothetical protein n=1 Tax=Streptomyces antimycoticus TaxID=68175 RepID=UPI0010F8ABBF|nr:hypothetical protein [Streptomyces antimycoticus]
MSQEIARITAIETAVDRGHTGADSELACYAPAAAAALNLLADAVNRGGADHDDVVQALKDAGVHSAFAAVLDAAAGAVTEGMDDPFDFDDRLHSENLQAAAGQVRDAFQWL